MPFYTPTPVTDSFDDSVMTVVSVIASFNTNGAIKPLYVRIKEESLKIYSCYCQPLGKVLIYHCEIIDNGCMKPLVLTYHPDHSFWTVKI